MKPMYTAVATAEGGRSGHAKSDDGALDVALSTPKSMGGPGGTGTNPEQLFAAGYAACFQSAMLFIAGQKKVDTSGCKVTAHVGIGMLEDRPGFALTVHHEVDLPTLAQADAESLVHDAHQVCPYSNATRGNINVGFTVRGAA
jgi:lipoyl-dependent peroxiredoxin